MVVRLLVVVDNPRHAVWPLLDDVDPRHQSVPHKFDVVGSQQAG